MNEQVQTEQSINNRHRETVSLLKEKRLMEAIKKLNTQRLPDEGGEVYTRLESYQTSYGYMLQYLRQGMDDPQREAIYNDLLRKVWKLADDIRLHQLDGVSRHAYHLQNRSGGTSPLLLDLAYYRERLESFPDDLAISRLDINSPSSLTSLVERHDTDCSALFKLVWKNRNWTKPDLEEARHYLSSTLIIPEDLALLVSAVMMSLLECFDEQKLSWLIDAYAHANTSVSQRALVGIAFAAHAHADRIALYPELEARFSLLADDSRYCRLLGTICLQLLQSQETEKVKKKISEEILPEMMDSIQKMKQNKCGLNEHELDEDDFNPDWEMIDKTLIGDKIRQMGELQMEGADINLATFAPTKNIPFFNEISHWFLPFHPYTSLTSHLLDNAGKEGNIFTTMLKLGMLCDNDKYSFCHMMSRLPQNMQSGMLGQFMTHEEIDDITLSEEAKHFEAKNQTSESRIRYYLQDLYRFFTLSPFKSEFRNPFQEHITGFALSPALSRAIMQADTLKAMGNFLFAKEHFEDAYEVYSRLIHHKMADADILQKMGYCQQKNQRYAEAIAHYKDADTLKPDTLWTIRQMGNCYRHLEQYADALEQFKKVEAIQPDNTRNLFYCASCLLYLDRAEEALNYLFKMDYLKPETPNTWRAIGWAAFVCGKYEQASLYFGKLTSADTLASDYLNAGHTAWMQGASELAANLYKQAASHCGSTEEFRTLFFKDSSILAGKGISQGLMRLIADLAIA